MSGICPTPRERLKNTYDDTIPIRDTYTTYPPNPLFNTCLGATYFDETIGPRPDGTDTTTTVCCPSPGPPGPAGAIGPCGAGFSNEGEWVTGTSYVTYDGVSNCASSVVSNLGNTYVCVFNHTSGDDVDGDQPGDPASLNWEFYWELLVPGGTGGLDGEDKSLFDNFFDWIKDIPNWGVGDWVKGIAGVAAAVWVGNKVIDMMSETGVGDGDSDQRFTGTYGYNGSLPSPYLPDVISYFMESWAGLESTEYDVSELPNTLCEIKVGSSTSVDTTVTLLRLIFGFDIVESEGKVKFRPQNKASVATITPEDRGFEKSKSDYSRYDIIRKQGIELPRRVEIHYIDREFDYSTSIEIAEDPTYIEGNVVQIRVPLVLDKATAKTLAERILAQAHDEAMRYEFTLNWSFANLEASDIITDTEFGKLRIININESPNNVFNITAVGASYLDYYSVPSGISPSDTTTPTNTEPFIGYSAGILLDLPPLNGSDSEPRLYAAVHGYGAANWSGANIYNSDDGGSSYSIIGTADKEATVGLVATAISGVPGSRSFFWDEDTVISVAIKTNELLSAPNDLAVYNGAYNVLVGNEIIGYRTATLTGVDGNGNSVYDLTGLIRGRNGTEWAIQSHVDNELFVLLDSSLVRLPFPVEERGREQYFKFVTSGSDPSVVAVETITPYMINLIPWKVANPSVVQSGTDWVVSWTERPSFNNEWQDYLEVSKDSDWAGWYVFVMDTGVPEDDPAAEVRSTLVTAPTWTYTEAMQIEDFGSAIGSTKIKIITMSKRVGGGYSSIITS